MDSDQQHSEEVFGPSRRVLGIPALLNPDNTPVDIEPLIKQLATFSVSGDSPLFAPPEIRRHLVAALDHLSHHSSRIPPRPNPQGGPPVAMDGVENRTEQKEIQINRETILDVLYTYPQDTIIEYPETSSTGFIGHLFHMNSSNTETWANPIHNVAYSKGKPAGQTQAGKPVFVNVLKDAATGKPVPCVLKHSTCQGVKVCPYSDKDLLSLPHVSAMRSDVQDRLENDRLYRLQSSSPSKDVFLHTVAYLAAVQKLGCNRPLNEQTFLTASEEEERQARELYLLQIQRGSRIPEGICDGRLVFDHDEGEKPYIWQDHFFDGEIGSGNYDVNYIEAVLTGDLEESERIERIAENQGYGPLTECTTVANFSTQKMNCPVSHRDLNGALVQPLLDRLPCTAKFRVYEPISEVRASCPYVLIVTTGEHEHPVPLPLKTPPKIREKLMHLLEEVGDDLPDLTPRRFLRHPILKSFLKTQFPSLISPTLADWHVSLANRSHVHAYIKDALKDHYPFGTGWAGVVNLKEHQDSKLPKELHYIRRILAVNIEPADEAEMNEDDDISVKKDNRLRIIICMTPEASRRLLASGRHLQCDIAFKRIVGFKEFEVAGMEKDANTSIVYIRIYMNRMSALAHQRVFEEIEAVIFEDTGKHLQWHPIHAASKDDGLDRMILSWVADQHRGQAKGLGLHLQKIASKMPQKRDLYQPERYIQDLGPYEHLHRIFLVCTVHYYRLVNQCATTDQIRWLLRSLVCMEHPDWEGTIQTICEHGGKAARDWIQNKISGGFVLQGICWERSYIPRPIWEAASNNSNLIESVHSDVNREGLHSTLVGGLKKGQHFDAMKMKALNVCSIFFLFLQLSDTFLSQMFEKFGVKPSYKSTHISENAVSNLKRRGKPSSSQCTPSLTIYADAQIHKRLMIQDTKIEAWNTKYKTTLAALFKAQDAVHAKAQQLRQEENPQRRQKMEKELGNKEKQLRTTNSAFEKHYETRKEYIHMGSGKITLLSL
ncbi:hypothetical protein C8R43DRAFT_892789 [Mycena crocata]|nr:hypothetical protein C8R43DRAFT_892789 [Mycena crocata]